PAVGRARAGVRLARAGVRLLARQDALDRHRLRADARVLHAAGGGGGEVARVEVARQVVVLAGRAVGARAQHLEVLDVAGAAARQRPADLDRALAAAGLDVLRRGRRLGVHQDAERSADVVAGGGVDAVVVGIDEGVDPALALA